jgi:hypothetical protein
MIDEDGIFVQFCWIPDEGLTGLIMAEYSYSVLVRYNRNGVQYDELFDIEDIIPLKEIHIPIEREEPQ